MTNELAIKILTGDVIGTTEQTQEAVTMAVRSLSQPEQQWIPCSERLPELDAEGYSEKVLTCYSNFSGMDICEYRVENGKGKWYLGDLMDSPEDLGINVIAWMPLPKPYKEA